MPKRRKHAIVPSSAKNALEWRISVKQNEEELKSKKMIEIIAMVTEYRNAETLNHGKRVGAFTKILAEYVNEYYAEVDFTPEEIECISSCAMVHDIGKIAMPDRILLKEGHLTKAEEELFRTHTLRGAEMVSMLALLQNEMYARHCYDICYSHHERYDGTGYPEGLKGEEIPIAAQIVGLADLYDTLVGERVFKNAFSKERAFDSILDGEYGIFSPRLLECFRKARKRLEEAADEAQVVLI